MFDTRQIELLLIMKIEKLLFCKKNKKTLNTLNRHRFKARFMLTNTLDGPTSNSTIIINLISKVTTVTTYHL
jgi:hypothetical protein